jgi:hypothetical protein
MSNFEKLTDRELYLTCKKWGAEVLAARRKFAGLLPEVWRREQAANEKGHSWLRKRGFTCLYDFAARLAGMSRKQVDQVVRMERRFSDKPILHEALVSGAVSANKLARVVSIVTVENQSEILKKVEMLSSCALNVFVKDSRKMDRLYKPQSERTSLSVQTQNVQSWLTEATSKTEGQPKPEKLPVILDEDVANELMELQSKNMDVNALLREFLRQRKEHLEREKAVIAEKQEREHDERAQIGYPASRYVPAEVRQIIKEEFGDMCSVPGCNKPAENLHHEKGFAISQSHDPRYLKPLCRGHHELAHAGRG